MTKVNAYYHNVMHLIHLMVLVAITKLYFIVYGTRKALLLCTHCDYSI